MFNFGKNIAFVELPLWNLGFSKAREYLRHDGGLMRFVKNDKLPAQGSWEMEG